MATVDKPVMFWQNPDGSTYTVRSTTNATKFYQIRQNSDGLLECSCPSYEYRHKCKHADAVTRYVAGLARNKQHTTTGKRLEDIIDYGA